MSEKLLTVSFSPHTYNKHSISSLMWCVVIALCPALFAGVYYFGIGALKVTAVSILSCVMIEYIITRFMLKRPKTITDGSAVITGLLLAFNLPSNLPLWMIVIGSLIAIGVAKMTYGGLGNNPFNPALVGRVFLLVSFPVEMTSWPTPIINRWTNIDALTAATPLGIIKEGIKNQTALTQLMSEVPNYWQLFLGNRGGCIGETCILALLIGGVFLLYKRVITWHIPVATLGAFTILSTILWKINPQQFADPIFHLLSGGIVLGAIFMATDYVTSPMTSLGMLIYGSLIGILTVLIRNFGAYPEGTSFAILIMNAFTPLINRYCKPHRYGEGKRV